MEQEPQPTTQPKKRGRKPNPNTLPLKESRKKYYEQNKQKMLTLTRRNYYAKHFMACDNLEEAFFRTKTRIEKQQKKNADDREVLSVEDIT